MCKLELLVYHKEYTNDFKNLENLYKNTNIGNHK